MNFKATAELLNEGAAPVITVFGDFCLDKYLYIDAALDEPSVETGLTAYQVTEQRLYAGAAGTITNNLCALGARVYCVGVAGEDGEGVGLLRKLREAGADTSFMVNTDRRQTCTYIKPMRRENGSVREMNRIDLRNFTDTPAQVEDELISNLERATGLSDAVIVCDQYLEENKAAVTARVREAIARLGEKYPDVIWYADSRGYADKFDNVIIKCNHREIAAIFGEDPEDMTPGRAKDLAARMYAEKGKPVIVTMGERGSVVFDGKGCDVPAFPVEGEIDICGAGDACNAGTVFALTKGAELREAAAVGNACSSIVIKQIGATGTAALRDVLYLLKNYGG